ncbi:MAG: DNA replication/repair protein RecF [Oscillospiraceae bacterium]
MIVKNLTAKDFRNLRDVSFSPCEKMNVIYGNNAQGKTNLLEAVYLFSGMKSFRGAKEKEFITFGEKNCKLDFSFETARRSKNAELVFGISGKSERKIILNGVECKTPSELFGNFKCVVFSPEYLNFVKGNPELRRKFLDIAVSQIRPNYLKTLRGYNKALLQRNNIIKNYRDYENIKEALFPWDIQLARAGSYLTVMRLDYIKKLKIACSEYYKGLSGGEALEIEYSSPIFSRYGRELEYGTELVDYYLSRQQSMIKTDIKLGYTLNGFHRDDLVLKIDGKPLKIYGSQGQQRSAVIALKLSEAYILEYAFDEAPVMLLDDVLSELDLKRQSFLLNNISNMQTILTCCDINNIKQLKGGKVFFMENGRLTERQ